MRHHVDERKLGMKTAHRRAFLSNLATSLILHDKIETTLTRAKELRPIADKIVTLSKRATIAARRRAIALLRSKIAAAKAFAELPGRFAGRNGGYTRILKLGLRHGDSAPMAMIEYLAETRPEKDKKEKKKEKVSKVKKAASSLREKVFKRSREKELQTAPKAEKKIPQRTVHKTSKEK